MLFSFLLRGPAAEWYESSITNATTWEKVRTSFINRFSDRQNKLHYRMEVEHCIRGDGEEIQNFLHRIKRTVNNGWSDDLNGIEGAHQAQRRQRRQRYIDYSLKGLRPRYLQRKAQDILMEKPKRHVDWFFYQNKTKGCIILKFLPTFQTTKSKPRLRWPLWTKR